MSIRIAISGAGIGGLFAALSLLHHLPEESRNKVQVDIYERSKDHEEIGAGLGLTPRVWSVVEAIGIADQLSKYTPPGATIESNLWRKGELLFAPDMNKWTGGPPKPFHRGDLHSALLGCLHRDQYTIHLSKKVVGYAKPDKGITLSFGDGTTAECDLLIGADGVHSGVRKAMLGGAPGSEPLYSGLSTYRSIIDPARLPSDHYAAKKAGMTIGKGTLNILTYPITHGDKTVVNTVAQVMNVNLTGTRVEGPIGVAQSDTQEMRALIREPLDEDRQVLVDAIDKCVRWAVCTVDPLDSYIEKGDDPRICLLGDAAHAMTPSLGSGAGSAIEDGYLLGFVIAQAISSGSRNENLKRASAALRIYDQIRRPISNLVQANAMKMSRLFTFVDLPEDEPAESLEQKMSECWTLFKDNLPAEQIQTAKAMLQNEVVPK